MLPSRRLVERVGGKAGNVIDLQVSHDFRTVPQVRPAGATSYEFYPMPHPDELVDDDKGRQLLVRVPATVTLQARTD